MYMSCSGTGHPMQLTMPIRLQHTHCTQPLQTAFFCTQWTPACPRMCLCSSCLACGIPRGCVRVLPLLLTATIPGTAAHAAVPAVSSDDLDLSHPLRSPASLSQPRRLWWAGWWATCRRLATSWAARWSPSGRSSSASHSSCRYWWGVQGRAALGGVCWAAEVCFLCGWCVCILCASSHGRQRP